MAESDRTQSEAERIAALLTDAIKPKQQDYQKATLQETAQFWIERIKENAIVPISAINPTLAREILKSGEVSEEDLRARGIVF